MLLPFTNLTAYIDEDDGEVVDQFMLTMGSSGYILCKAIDMARENNFRYVKILSAEYTLGNQSGGFTCQPEGEEQGEILTYQDEAFTLSVSCMNFTPEDTDYMDTELYESFLDILDDENDGFSSDQDESDQE